MNDWIFFDTSLRPQIENGEYAVLTGNGRPVRIICWDAKDRLDRPIVVRKDDRYNWEDKA